MDSMNEENDEYGDTVSSAPKRKRSRNSSVWSDFEILPKGPNGKERAKCKKCQNYFVASASGTTSLLRHRAKCHEVDNQIVSRQPLNQVAYRKWLHWQSLGTTIRSHLQNMRTIGCFIIMRILMLRLYLGTLQNRM